MRLEFDRASASVKAAELNLPAYVVASNGFRPLLNVPELAAPFAAMMRALNDGTLPPRLRELAILRTGLNALCAYEVMQHRPLAAAAGLTEEEIAAVFGEVPIDRLAQIDRGVLEATDELCRAATLSEGSWAALAATLRPAHILELTMVVGFWRMIAGWLNANQTPLE